MKKYFSHAPTSRNCHIYRMLQANGKKRALSFHTPGHKVSKWDITELSYSDCLANPTDVILRAQRDVEDIVRSKASEFLTDGSTSGVYTLLYLLKEKGVKKVALSPFSHISVFRACALFGLNPVIIEGQTPFSQPTAREMEEALLRADALFLTSPNYYGKIADLPLARAVCDEQNKPLVIDGAHGGHLHADPVLYAGKYADAWVDGAHKSMPAMTQGALVSVAREDWVEDLRKIVPLFRTTSPSYPILASIEYAFKYPENEKLAVASRAFMQANRHRIYQSDDWTKVCVRFGRHCPRVSAWLEKQGIYAEFQDGEYLLFYLSPATKVKDFERLKRKLLAAFVLFPVEESEPTTPFEKAPVSGEKEWVEIEKAEGRVAASSFGLFPPCLPLAVDGQRIDGEILRRLQSGGHTFGVEAGKVCVYTEGEKV